MGTVKFIKRTAYLLLVFSVIVTSNVYALRLPLAYEKGARSKARNSPIFVTERDPEVILRALSDESDGTWRVNSYGWRGPEVTKRLDLEYLLYLLKNGGIEVLPHQDSRDSVTQTKFWITEPIPKNYIDFRYAYSVVVYDDIIEVEQYYKDPLKHDRIWNRSHSVEILRNGKYRNLLAAL